MFKMHKVSQIYFAGICKRVVDRRKYMNQLLAPWSLLMVFFTAKWPVLLMPLIENRSPVHVWKQRLPYGLFLYAPGPSVLIGVLAQFSRPLFSPSGRVHHLENFWSHKLSMCLPFVLREKPWQPNWGAEVSKKCFVGFPLLHFAWWLWWILWNDGGRLWGTKLHSQEVWYRFLNLSIRVLSTKNLNWSTVQKGFAWLCYHPFLFLNWI